MTISMGSASFTTESLFTFEAHYFRLKLMGSSASGFTSDGEPVFVLYNGQERLSPRTFLFSGDPTNWIAPTLIQSQALLFQFKNIRSARVALNMQYASLAIVVSKGIKNFARWRFVCSLLDLPMDPLILSPRKAFDFCDEVLSLSRVSVKRQF